MDLGVELEQDWAVEMFSELLGRSPAVVRGGFDLRSLHLELTVDDGEEDLGRILETHGLGHEATQMLALFCSDAHQTSPTLPSTICSSCAWKDRSTTLARANLTTPYDHPIAGILLPGFSLLLASGRAGFQST